MADTSILGELLVLIKGDNAQYDKGIDASQKKTEKFQASMTKFGKNLSKNVTLPIIGVGAGLVKLVSSIGQSADKLLDLEQITGLSTTTLQEFKNVATVAGVSFEGLTGIVQKFSSRLPTIEAGTSETAIAFKQLGVDLRDASGEIRSTEEIVPELITSLQGIENVTERNSIAQQVFGKSLGDLAPVLGMTAEQTQAARDEAHELGLVWSNESIQLANEFRVESEKLTTQFKQQGVELGTSLIPVFQEALPVVRDLLDKIVDGITTFSNLSEGTKKLIFGIAGVTAAIGPAITAITKMNKAFKLLASPTGGIGLALIAITSIVAGIKKIEDANLKKNEENFDGLAESSGRTAKELNKINLEFANLVFQGQSLSETEKQIQDQFGLTKNELVSILAISKDLYDEDLKYYKELDERINATNTRRQETKKTVEETTDEINNQTEATHGLTQAQLDAYVAQNDLVNEVISSGKTEIELIKEKIAEINKLSLADGKLKDNQLKATQILQEQINAIEEEERTQREADYAERLEKENALNNAIYALQLERAEKEEAARISRIEKLEEEANFITGIAGSINTIWQNNNETRLAAIDSEEEAAIAALVSEADGNENYAAEKLAIEKESALKAYEIKKQEFIANKALALAQIVIDTAAGVAKVYGQTGIFGLAAQVPVIAMGVAQAAIVASEPAPVRPQLNTGAVVSGSRRGVDVTVGENNQGEIIQGMGPQGKALRQQLANETADVLLSRMGGGTSQTININGSGIWTKRDLDEFAIKIRPSIVRANQRVGA